MNDAIEFYGRIGDDGMLDLHLNLGAAQAQKDVVVTIKPLPCDSDKEPPSPLNWSEFIDRTYGSCAGLGLERPAQGEYEQREPLE